MSAIGPELSIVIPAFNEAAQILQTLDNLSGALAGFGRGWEIRVVDDGSVDDTPSIVERVSLRNPQVVLQREPHRGKGAAVRAGLLRARGALRLMCDADLSVPAGEIPRFLEMVPSECDIAIASREGPGAHRVGEPAQRHVLGRAFNALVRALVLPGLHDTQCGFKLFTSEAVEAIFPKTTLSGWAFDVEALFIAQRLGLRIREVPVEWHFRAESRVSVVRDPIRMFTDLWTIRRNARRGLYE